MTSAVLTAILFIWAPLRIIGATGSPGNPMVLY
jgi:hypothetical protein